jgi:alkane 1-monooxygenase
VVLSRDTEAGQERRVKIDYKHISQTIRLHGRVSAEARRVVHQDACRWESLRASVRAVVTRLVRLLGVILRANQEWAFGAWRGLRLLGWIVVPLILWTVVEYELRRPVEIRSMDHWLRPWLHVFVTFTLVDYAIGRDRVNGVAPLVARLRLDVFLRVLPALCFPMYLGLVVLGARLVAEPELSWTAGVAWMSSCGLLGGTFGIVAAHELIHRSTRFERVCGGLLLSVVAYGTFKVEHLRGHHVDVATPLDPSTAAFGRGLYAFNARAIVQNVAKAFRLQAESLRKQQRPVIGLKNELLWWTGASIALALSLAIAFGPAGLLFFVVQAAVAIWTLEAVNYVEHYGLRRRRLASGHYEKVSAAHSWDAPFLWSNWFLFNLQRHADHHVRSAKPYYTLDHSPSSPQLPGPYSAMVLLAHVPPLWRLVMDRRLGSQSDPDAGADTEVTERLERGADAKWLSGVGVLLGLSLMTTPTLAAQQPDVQAVPVSSEAPTQPAMDIAVLLEMGDVVLDIREVVAKAVAGSPDVQAAQAGLREARAQTSASAVGLLPRLAVSASYRYLSPVDESTAFPVGASSFVVTFPQVRDRYALRVEGTLPVTDILLRTLPTLAAGRHLSEARNLSARAARQGTALLAHASYYEYLRARAQVIVAEASLRDAELHRGEVALQVDAGTLGLAALLTADSQRKRVAIELEHARASMASSHDQLEHVMRTKLPPVLATRESIARAAPPAAMTLAQAIERGLRMRPELRSLRRLVQSRESYEDAAHATSIPALALVAATDIERPEPRTFPQRADIGLAWDVGIVAHWSPTDVASNANLSDVADARTAAARAELEQAKNDVRREISEGFHRFGASRNALDIARSGLSVAEENYQTHLLLFRSGRIPSRELQDAENELRMARQGFVDIAVDLRLAEAHLKYALGDEM